MASNNPNALILPPMPATGTNAVVEEIRDIKQPVAIRSNLWWVWLIAAALVAVILFFLLRKKKFRPPPLPLLIPPHRKAKERLRAATEMFSDPYKFCSLVSDVTRVYLEERFNLHAPDQTTDEFLAELRESSLLKDEHKILLEDFLTRCDLVKFAKHEPSEPELRGLLEAALRLVDETQEIETPVAAKA